jgi:hypothetical protein
LAQKQQKTWRESIPSRFPRPHLPVRMLVFLILCSLIVVVIHPQISPPSRPTRRSTR